MQIIPLDYLPARLVMGLQKNIFLLNPLLDVLHRKILINSAKSRSILTNNILQDFKQISR